MGTRRRRRSLDDRGIKKGDTRRPSSAVCTLLPRRLELQVRFALGHDTEILRAESWNDLDRLIKKRALRAVILDPATEDSADNDRVVRLFTRYPSLPVVAYVSLDAARFNAVTRLSRVGLEHVVLHRYDDAPERFREIIERATADPLVHRVLDSIRPALERLPLELSIAVENLLREPHRYHAALDLHSDTSYSTLQLYQHFRSARLASPRTFVIAARALRAYSYLRDPGYSVLDVTDKLGYHQPRILTNHALMVFGLTPGRARRRLSEQQAVKRVLAFLHSGGRSAARRVPRGAREKGSAA